MIKLRKIQSCNIYIFNFLSGKIIYKITNNQYKPKEGEYNTQKFITTEKEIEKNIETQNQPNLQFDESENYLYYPTWEGIKLINLFQYVFFKEKV